jgi:hypothetical protein
MTPITGIARKPRSDKGLTRKSSIDQWTDVFMGWTADKQTTALALLQALHRQLLRGAIKPATEAKEDDNG